MLGKLDPQAQMILKQIGEIRPKSSIATVPTSLVERISSIRKSMTEIVPLGYPFEPVLSTKDFDIPRSGGTIRVRLYMPKTAAPSPILAPALIYYHGGGFVAGDLDGYDTLLRAVTNRGRCVVVSVAYRLAPENPYPAANDDAWTVLKWVADHASEIGIDPQRLSVGGDSAGGCLAALVAQKAAKNGLRLRLQVLLYPNLDATMSNPSWTELGGGDYIVSYADMLAWYDAFLPSEINREDPSVSPLFATDLSNLAPAFIVTADHDPLRDEGNEYASRLKAANIVVDHTCWPGMIHGFASFAGVVDAGKTVINQVGVALRKAFE